MLRVMDDTICKIRSIQFKMNRNESMIRTNDSKKEASTRISERQERECKRIATSTNDKIET